MPSKTNKIAEKAPDVSPDPEFRNDSEEARTLPLLPVRDTVLFPHAVLPLTVGRESSAPRSRYWMCAASPMPNGR